MTDPAMPTNEDIADVLGRIADLLEAQDADRFRVNAYRRAAKVTAELAPSAAETATSGDDRTLEDLPGIGQSIAAIILFSNSPRAHALQQTRDWVVVYFERDGKEDRCTVVTEPDGFLQGRRVVRGREKECLEHYRTSDKRQARGSKGKPIEKD